MLKRIILIGVALIIPMMSSAQKMLTASGEYTYYAPLNVSPEQAELTAIERAKISIIETEFGAVMGVKNFTQVENTNGDSSVKFLSSIHKISHRSFVSASSNLLLPRGLCRKLLLYLATRLPL